MSPEWRERLIAALESGAYKRHVAGLRSDTTGCMCVQGVLLDISGLGKWSESGSAYEFRPGPDGPRLLEGGYISHPFLLAHFGMTRSEAMELFSLSDNYEEETYRGWDHVLTFLKTGVKPSKKVRQGQL